MADGITISAAAVSAIVGAVVTYLKMKAPQKVKVEPQPLEVETTKKGPYVTVGECKNYRCAIKDRLDEQREGFQAVLAKLDENDKRSEQRAASTHSRIDPLISAIGEMRGTVDVLRDAHLGDRRKQ